MLVLLVIRKLFSRRNNSTDSKDKKVAEEEEGQSNEVPNKLHMAINLDYKQDNTLASAAVVCHNSHLALRWEFFKKSFLKNCGEKSFFFHRKSFFFLKKKREKKFFFPLFK